MGRNIGNGGDYNTFHRAAKPKDQGSKTGNIYSSKHNPHFFAQPQPLAPKQIALLDTAFALNVAILALVPAAPSSSR